MSLLNIRKERGVKGAISDHVYNEMKKGRSITDIIQQIERPDTDEALRVAVTALYFDDSSDFQAALWEVVRALSPEMAELLETSPIQAFERIHEEP